MLVIFNNSNSVLEYWRTPGDGYLKTHLSVVQEDGCIMICLRNKTKSICYRAKEEWLGTIFNWLKAIKSKNRFKYIDLPQYVVNAPEVGDAPTFRIDFCRKVHISGVTENDVKDHFVLNFNDFQLKKVYFYFSWEHASVLISAVGLALLSQNYISNHSKIALIQELTVC